MNLKNHLLLLPYHFDNPGQMGGCLEMARAGVGVGYQFFFISKLSLPAGRTLNPIMIASEADANITSVSVIAPTPCIILIWFLSRQFRE
jgi:hypothetical protein